MPRGFTQRRIKFTAKTAQSLPLPERDGQRQADYFDQEIPGFGLRVSYGGARTWFVNYRASGVKRRQKIGPAAIFPLAAARDAARKILQRVHLGEDPQQQKLAARQAMTFAELCEEYMQRYSKPRKRSWRNDQQRITHDLLPALGNTKADAVTRAQIRKFLDEMVNRGAPKGANKALETARAIYNWGIQNDLVTQNPAAGIQKPAEPGERHRFLTADELEAYWRVLGEEAERAPVVVGVLKTMLLTGQRRGEIVRMRWEDLDLRDHFWNIPAELTKTKLPYRVPITEKLREMIENMRGRDETWVFPQTQGGKPIGASQVKLHFDRIVQRAGLKDFVPHDTRHTVATQLAQMGIADEVIARVLHHAVSNRMTARYIEHKFDSEKRATMEMWERRLAEIVGEREPDSKVVVLR